MREMTMVNLTRAHNELFRRMPDEMFPSLQALAGHSRQRKEQSVERWERPQDVTITSDLTLAVGDNPDYRLNDWSLLWRGERAWLIRQLGRRDFGSIGSDRLGRRMYGAPQNSITAMCVFESQLNLFMQATAFVVRMAQRKGRCHSQ
jgi:hypothetical protein